MSINIKDLRSQLSDLRKKETVAQTREQVLNEEKERILVDLQTLFTEVEKLNIVSKEELVSNNLNNVIDKLYKYIESEITKSNIPKELL